VDCSTTKERLNAYLDGELPPRIVAQVRQHLQTCARCTAELDELKRLNRVLDALQGMEVPEGFARRVVPAPTPAGARPLVVRALNRAAAALVACAGLWVGLTMGASVDPAGGGGAAELDDLDLQVEAIGAARAESVADAFLAFLGEGE
jgi:anti-sigma factor RsiW